MNVDIRDALFFCHLEKCVEMCLMAVNAARRDESQKMERTALCFHTRHDFKKRLVLKEIAVFDIARDARELLVNDAAGTDVRMTDLGVTHLSIWQSDIFTGCLEFRCWEFLDKSI